MNNMNIFSGLVTVFGFIWFGGMVYLRREVRKTIREFPCQQLWYVRLDYIKNIVRQFWCKTMITPLLVKFLKCVSLNDPDSRIRSLAADMIKSYMSGVGFYDTEPYQEMLAEKCRLAIRIKSNFGYNPEDVWYTRLEALENLATMILYGQMNRDEMLSPNLQQDLVSINKIDDDSRLREAAGSIHMLTNYTDKKTIREFLTRNSYFNTYFSLINRVGISEDIVADRLSGGNQKLTAIQ